MPKLPIDRVHRVNGQPAGYFIKDDKSLGRYAGKYITAAEYEATEWPTPEKVTVIQSTPAQAEAAYQDRTEVKRGRPRKV